MEEAAPRQLQLQEVAAAVIQPLQSSSERGNIRSNNLHSQGPTMMQATSGIPGPPITGPSSFNVTSATTDLLSSRSDGSWCSGATASYSAGDPVIYAIRKGAETVVQKLIDQPLLLSGFGTSGGLEQLSRQTTANTNTGRKTDRSQRLSTVNNGLPPVPSSGTGVPGTGNKKSQYHRTKLCPWHREGKCFMGEACNYAHSRDELRPKPDLSKTKLCPELVKGKQCTRQGCRFAHDFVELRATSAFFKTRICKYWQRGYCPAGYECRHAHGREDLRTSPSLPGQGADDRQCMWGWPHAPPFGPPASSLPSPSFLSTSTSTPNSNKTPTESLVLPSATLEQCVALLAQQQPPPPPTPPANAQQQGALEQIKLWISQEVERQVAHRASKPTSLNIHDDPRTPRPDLPETAMLLPQDVLQNLNNSATPVSGLDATFAWASAGESPMSFAAAVKSLQGGPSFPAAPSARRLTGSSGAADPLGDATPTQVLLRALGGMTSKESHCSGDESQGDLDSESPLHLRTEKQFTTGAHNLCRVAHCFQR